MATPRENLLRMLHRQGYDEVPAEFFLCPHLIDVFHEKVNTGLSYFDYFEMPWRRLRDLTPENDDRSRFEPYFQGERHDEIDEWGVGHYWTPTSMHMSHMVAPLRNADSEEILKAFPLPTFSDLHNEDLAAEARALKDRGIAVVGNMQCTIWETAWYLRGMEPLMMDMACEDPMADIWLDRIMETSLSKAKLYARAGADILYLGDDVGTQKALMMSVEMYRDYLKPRLKRIIDEVKAINPEILVVYHTCGYVEPMIPELMEAGIDVLNPIQPECMDADKIIQEYGDVLSFHGALGTQSIMPFGTPEEIRKQTFHLLDLAGDKGGLFVAPTHLLEPEVPWENIMAYLQACRDYRR